MARRKHHPPKRKHKKKAKAPATTPATTGPSLEPVAGTITPAVAQAGDTGTTEAPPGGDLTGTAQLQEAVFSQGSGFVPQYQGNPDAAATEAQAQYTITQPQGAA